MTVPNVIAVAVIDFLADGSINVELSNAAGITAKKIDIAHVLLYKKLQELRAEERRADSIKQAELRAQAQNETQLTT